MMCDLLRSVSNHNEPNTNVDLSPCAVSTYTVYIMHTHSQDTSYELMNNSYPKSGVKHDFTRAIFIVKIVYLVWAHS